MASPRPASRSRLAATFAALLCLSIGAAADPAAAAPSGCSLDALSAALREGPKTTSGHTPALDRVGVFARVPASVDSGTRLTVCGLVESGKARGGLRTVRLEKRVDGKWVRSATVRTSRRFVVRGPVVTSSIVVRISVRDGRGKLIGASGARRVKVRLGPAKPAPQAPAPSAPGPTTFPAAPAPPAPTPTSPTPTTPAPTTPAPEPETPDPFPGGSIRFETRWRGGGSAIVPRTFTAVPGEPRTLDVDGNGTPDFDALVSFTGAAPSVEITPVDATAPPAAVTAVITDPQHRVLDRDGLRLGFDGVDGRSPDAFIASADAGAGLDLELTVDAPVGDSVPVVAEIFDGTPAAPVDPVELRADGDALADLRVRATVDRDAGTLDWALSDSGSAPKVLDALSIGTSSATPFASGLRTMRFDASHAPATGTFAADGAFDIATPSGTLARVAAIASTVATDTPPTTAGQRFARTATATTLVAESLSHAHLEGTKLVVEHTGSGTLDVSLAGDPAIEAELQGLPDTSEIDFDLTHAGTDADPQQVRFTGRDGASQAGLQQLTFTATGTTPLLGRAKVVSAELRMFHGDLVFSMAHEGASTKLDASAPGGGARFVDTLEFGAADSVAAIEYPESGGNPADGVVLHDETGDPFELGVRVTDFWKLESTFGTTTSIDALLAAKPFVVDGATDEAAGRLVVDGTSGVGLQVESDLDAGLLKVSSGGATSVSADYATSNPVAFGATSVAFVAEAPGPTIDLAFDSAAHPATGHVTGAEVTSAQPLDVRLALASAGQTAALPATGTTNTVALAASATSATLTARLRDLRHIEIAPQLGTLSSNVTVSRPLAIDATVPALDGSGDPTGTDVDFDAGIAAGPTQLSLGVAPQPSGGARFTWAANTSTSQVTVGQSGVELFDGTASFSADVKGVPVTFTTLLRNPDSDSTDAVFSTSVGSATTASGGPRIDELRIAAGSGALPSSGGNDKFTYRGSGSGDDIRVKLTNLKGAAITPAPFALELDQEDTLNGGTKPLDLDLAAPSASSPTDPVLGIAGTLNKPSFHTEFSATPRGAAPMKLVFAAKNGSTAAPRTMASLSLNLSNAGASPSTSVSLTNVPRTFSGCLAEDAGCVSSIAAHLPTALATWNDANACSPRPQVPSTSATQNRPYVPKTSFAFDDGGTSGTSASISAMVTVNASLTPAGGGSPTVLTNLRVHELRGDVGGGDTSFSFKPVVSISAGDVPRFYAFLDSAAKPFVINGLGGTDFVASLKIGTDGAPATANKRLAWVPGAVRGSILGCATSQNISTQSQGSLNCAGQKEMNLNTSLGTLNIFNLPLFGDVTNVC